MKHCSQSVSVLMLLALTAQADPNWRGQDTSQTEWGNFLNWDGGDKGGDLNNHFWIDPFRGATHYKMTFNRDGRSYASDGENNALKGTDNWTQWDFYNIWEVDLRAMNDGQVATWSGADENCGPNIRYSMYIGKDSGRGALAIQSGKTTVEHAVWIGQKEGRVGELLVNGGSLTVNRGIYLARDGAWRALLALNGGVFRNNAAVTGNEAGISDDNTSLKRGNGETQFIFNGGTIQIGDNNQSYPADGATFGKAGLTVDTDGKNATLIETVNATIDKEAVVLTKKGEGKLTVDALPQKGRVVVEKGTLAFATDSKRELAHRWSFTTDATDAVTGEAADGTDGQVSFSNGKVVMDVGGLNLGDNLWPADAMTVQIWATLKERTSWAKLFCWSGMQYSFMDGGGWSKFSLLGEGGTANLEATGGNIDVDQYCCYTMTLIPDGTGGTHLRLCRWNATTGELMNSRDFNGAGWLVSKINQENFWLGKSYWEDASVKAEYDEVRIWKGVFADSELKEQVLLGPDCLPGENAKANVLNSAASEDLINNNYLLHRWSFNGTLEDHAGESVATLKGDAALGGSGTFVRLPGGSRGAGWIDLGEVGGFPTNDTPFTIEWWVKSHEYVANRRIFSIGKRPASASEGDSVESLECGLHSYFADGDGEGKWWRVTARGGEDGEKAIAGQGWLEKGVEYHMAATFIPDSESKNTTCFVYAYRADGRGGVGVGTETIKGWIPSMVNDVPGKMCCWLGHSQWGDSDPIADYNEFRIWNGALTEAQLAINRALGPDRLPAIAQINPPRAFNLTVEDGASVDLMGQSATVGTLLGSGDVQNAGELHVAKRLFPGGAHEVGSLTFRGRLSVSGEIHIDEGDMIVVDGQLDLTDARIVLDGTHKLPIVFARASGGIQGVPEIVGGNYSYAVSQQGTSARIVKYPFSIIIR